jgi:hypothetical protein
MNIFHRTGAVLACGLAMAAVGAPALALDLGDLKGVLGGGSSGSGTSAMQSGSMGNAAGVLEYCVKNKYLSGDSASSLKDQLMGKLGSTTGQPAQKNPDYLTGAKGVLKTGSGSAVDLSGGGVKAAATKEACDAILNQARNFL